MPRKPLKTQCPQCDRIGHNRVEQNILPTICSYLEFNIKDSWFKLLKGITKDNAKVDFYKHTRKCDYCCSRFETLEIAQLYIDLLFSSSKELQEDNEEQLALIKNLKRENISLQKKLNEIQKIARSGTG